jgi:hypothetical protein
MQLSLSHRFKAGAFADVLSPPPGDKAYKIFRRIADPILGGVAPHVFKAEVDAYRIALAHPVLRHHVAEFFGPIAVSAVVDTQGAVISDRYWLDCCYAMRRLVADPKERKLGSFFNDDEWHLIEPLEQTFIEAGIDHVGDASVFYWKSGKKVLIDFGTYDAAADHAQLLPEVQSPKHKSDCIS